MEDGTRFSRQESLLHLTDGRHVQKMLQVFLSLPEWELIDRLSSDDVRAIGDCGENWEITSLELSTCPWLWATYSLYPDRVKFASYLSVEGYLISYLSSYFQ